MNYKVSFVLIVVFFLAAIGLWLIYDSSFSESSTSKNLIKISETLEGKSKVTVVSSAPTIQAV